MRYRRLLLALAALAVALAAAATATAGSGVHSFKTPGGKVKCLMFTEPEPPIGVLCITSLAPGVPPFPHPRCREGDPGGGLQLLLKARRAKGLCLSENPIIPPVRVLRYGTTIASAGLSCTAVSKSVGIRCTNPGGHGFEMSPSAWRRF
jgi:hypothetical protein